MDELDQFAAFLAGLGGNWQEWFASYSWQGADSDCGIRARFRLHRTLEAALQPGARAEAFQEVVGHILEWGGMKPLDDSDLRYTLATLSEFRLNGDERFALDSDLVWSNRIASTSKIYAMSDPRRWTIYDSRVGLAMRALATGYKEGARLPELLDFRVPPGRGGGGYITPNQARRGFLRTSRVLRQTAHQLNAAGVPRPAQALGCSEDTGGWQVYHLEMALFMLGRNDGDIVVG